MGELGPRPIVGPGGKAANTMKGAVQIETQLSSSAPSSLVPPQSSQPTGAVLAISGMLDIAAPI